MHRLTTTVATVLAIAACGTPRRPQLALTIPDRTSLASRCWQLRSDGWKDSFLPTSMQIRFDTASAGEKESPWRVIRIESTDTGFTNRLRIAQWAPYEQRDSLFAVIGDGYTGLELRLVIRPDSLTGAAYRFADAPHIRSGGRVRATSVSC